MRVAIVRSDIAQILLDDIESSSQRCFSAETAGQSRYFKKPTDAKLQAILTKYGIATGTLSVATLKAAIYPTATTVDVSTATIVALAGITALGSGPKAACAAEIQDLVAPKLVETGPVLLSFVKGKLAQLKKSSFQPGGTRSGLVAGICAAIVADDGTTTYTI